MPTARDEEVAARERSKRVGGRKRDEGGPGDDDVGAAPQPDQDAASPLPTNPDERRRAPTKPDKRRRAPTNRNGGGDPAAAEFGFENG